MNHAEDFQAFLSQVLGPAEAVAPGQSPLRPEYQASQPLVIPQQAPGPSFDAPYRSAHDQGMAEGEMALDGRRKFGRALEGIGAAVDQLGSAFDQRLSGVFMPRQTPQAFRPNVNPGIAQMAQQLLLASARR